MNRNSFDPRTSEFRLETSPFYLMAHADFRYHLEMESVLTSRGFNKSIYRILTILRETGCSSVTEISDIALIKRPTVSRVVDRMTKLGFVSTAPLASDNRVTEVCITEKGRQTLNELTPIVARQIERATRGISSEELDQLVLTLQKIGANLKRSYLE